MSETQTLRYELVFQGLRDSDPKTLRELKSALVLDLRLTTEQARQIIEHSPACIQTSPDRFSLNQSLDVLTRAGAKAIIKRVEQKKSIAARAKTVATLPENSSLPASPQTRQFSQKLSTQFPQTRERKKTSDDTSQAKLQSSEIPRTQQAPSSTILAKLRSDVTISPVLLWTLFALTCGLLIQVGLYADSIQYRRYRQTAQLLEKYIYFIVQDKEYGALSER
ncbi:MAG: hypothetical protein KDD64_01255 [Bdellovibrionales bacterium]|nr:hypothetical protein [Bdellovibrionales bacterium]